MADQVTYAAVGATVGESLPTGYQHDRYERALANGSDAFDLGAAGLRSCQAHLGSGIQVEPLDPPFVGATVALGVRLGPLVAIAPRRIVAVIDELDRYGFAYGTLPGHPEEGEEAFVVQRHRDGVAFRIVAFSRPAEALARVGGPVTRAIQQRATRAVTWTLLSGFVDSESM